MVACGCALPVACLSCHKVHAAACRNENKAPQSRNLGPQPAGPDFRAAWQPCYCHDHSTTPQHGWPAGPSGGCPAVQTLQRSRRASGTALFTHGPARDLLLSKCCPALWELPVEPLICALQLQQQGQQPGAGQKKRSALGDVTNSAVAAAQLPQKVGPAKSLRLEHLLGFLQCFEETPQHHVAESSMRRLSALDRLQLTRHRSDPRSCLPAKPLKGLSESQAITQWWFRRWMPCPAIAASLPPPLRQASLDLETLTHCNASLPTLR